MKDVTALAVPEAILTVSSPLTPRVSALISISAQDTDIACVNDALESLCMQSVLPDQLVVVIDGPLADEVEAVVAGLTDLSEVVSVDIVRVPYTGSIATTINDAIARCKGDWVMCLNGDSMCHQERLAIQLEYSARHPEIDAWFSWCEEMADGIKRVKASAIRHDAIVNTMRWRNPLVYSSALIRSSVLRQVGGYSRDSLGEYDLFVRLALAGARFRVIPAELVSLPARPRGGIRDAWQEACFRFTCWRSGFLDLRQFLLISIAHSLFSLLAAPLRRRLYALVRTSSRTPAKGHAIHHSRAERALVDAL